MEQHMEEEGTPAVQQERGRPAPAVAAPVAAVATPPPLRRKETQARSRERQETIRIGPNETGSLGAQGHPAAAREHQSGRNQKWECEPAVGSACRRRNLDEPGALTRDPEKPRTGTAQAGAESDVPAGSG
eukprot:7144528-Heterocapsa_arctica.AAC.1